jgi:hypothetical protein
MMRLRTTGNETWSNSSDPMIVRSAQIDEYQVLPPSSTSLLFARTGSRDCFFFLILYKKKARLSQSRVNHPAASEAEKHGKKDMFFYFYRELFRLIGSGVVLR